MGYLTNDAKRACDLDIDKLIKKCVLSRSAIDSFYIRLQCMCKHFAIGKLLSV